MALYMHIASGGTINFGKDSENAVSGLRRTPATPLAPHGDFHGPEHRRKGLWPSFNVSKFQGFITCKDTEPSSLHTLCDLSWDSVVFEQLTENATTISHSGCAQKNCRLCQQIIRSVHRWQLSRERIHNWVAQREATPRAFIPFVEKAIRNIDSDLAKLHCEQRKHLQQSLVCEDSEWSLGCSKTTARHYSSSAEEQHINVEVDINPQFPSNDISRLWMKPQADVQTPSMLPRLQSHTTRAGQQHLKAPSKMCIGGESQRLLLEILSSFCWDPLRGLTIVRSRLVRCGKCMLPVQIDIQSINSLIERVVISHVIKLYRSLQQFFDDFIPFTNLLALLTVSESLRCKPSIWEKLAMTYQCTWRFRHGTVLCIMKPSTSKSGSNIKSMIVALEDLKESALGNMVF